MFDQLDALRPAIYQAMIDEALGRKLPQLQEPGWMPLGGSNVDLLTGLDRRQTNDEVRYYHDTDPTMHYMVELENSYTFGRGVSVKAKDPEVDAWVQRFWRHPRNRASLTTAAAQWELNKELQIEGELFFIFYTSTVTGQVTVRTLQSQQVNKIINAKGDPKVQQLFHCQFLNPQKQLEGHWLLDYRIADATKQLYHPDFADANTEVTMMQVLTDSIGGRGISPKRTSVRWIKALTGFMQDRAAITLAASTFAFKQKIKGNRHAAQMAINRWGQYASQMLHGQDGNERRQGANTFIENEASNLEQMKFDTMSNNAYLDMRMFNRLAGIGSGVFEHYLGDPSTGNLATATAMELPMLKLFEFKQQRWADVLGEILNFVVLQGIRHGKLSVATCDIDQSGGYPVWVMEPVKGTDLTLDVIFPPIVQKDIAVQANALAQVATAEATSGQQMLPSEKKAEIALNLFGGDKDSGALIEAMKQNNFALPNAPASPPPPQTQNVNEADIGTPLPKTDAEKAPAVSKKELNQAVKDWEELPALDAILEELGVTLEDVDA